MNKKKGQSAANAAILIIVITVVLILYLLFLPPDERAKLLEGSSNGGSIDDPSPDRPLTLLQESIGRLEYRSDQEVNYNLQSFTLRATTQAREIISRNSAYTRATVFGVESDSMTFNIDLDNTEDVILSFNIARRQGDLEILLNGKRIFFGEIMPGNSPPLFIDFEDLERSNIIEFRTNSPGLAFWRVNSYLLTDIRILGDVTDTQRATSIQTIDIRQRDYQDLTSFNIRYVPVCEGSDVERFEIKVNDFLIFRGIPDCNIINTITVARDFLYEGMNNFEFSINRGEVIVDDLRITGRVNLPENPIYYFEVDEDYFNNETLMSQRKAEMTIRFTNTDRKSINFFINGMVVGVTTQERTHTRDISSQLVPGTNTIEVRPRQTIEIPELKIVLK
ncbi:MAG: hypothetical protein ACMXX7_00945 [Candidatus Woesearchaeota archaeon]